MSQGGRWVVGKRPSNQPPTTEAGLMMEIPDGAVEAAIRSGDALLDEMPDGAVREGCEAVVSWLVENDPGFLLRLVFSGEEQENLLAGDTPTLDMQRKFWAAFREPERSG